jgi:nucleoside-diphosphate-sugar epimerase
MPSEMKRILVTGAAGQIGSELTPALRERYGAESVVACDAAQRPRGPAVEGGPFYYVDVTERASLEVIIRKHEIDTVFHLAALLSAVGEKNPRACWNVNMTGTINVLEAAMEHHMTRVIVPSSIAAFGPETPRDPITPQDTILKPRTMYGVTKVAGELVCDYYVRRFGLDVRGLRYPGIISSVTLPGGGTTDFAVEIFYYAVEGRPYTCFVRDDTRLPMMYMPDCIKATIDLAEADPARLRHHADFNVNAMSFSAAQLTAEIRKHVPDFQVDYEPDFRQQIADSWPRALDDTAAREEWGWHPAWDLPAMTRDMLVKLGERQAAGCLR